jgi:starch phosphorylase
MEGNTNFHDENDNPFNLPARLRRLSDLAYNLWWTWNMEAVRLYRLLDPDLWETTEHNPVRFLRLVSKESLATAARDRRYLEKFDQVIAKFDDYLSQDQTWYVRHHPDLINHPIAYFSTEFGLHEALPFYAGGLGILSGDFLKEASDLGFPLVAIGFLYTEG